MNVAEMEKWVWDTLQSGLSKNYTYHNMAHTSSVVGDLKHFVDFYDISRYNYNLLKTAALFHDIAFVKSHVNHEEESAQIASEQLPRYGFTKAEIDAVAGMIMATKLPQKPRTFLECVLCDADLFYLGGKQYFKIAEGLRQEWSNIGFMDDELKWVEAQLNFLQAHSYHTSYAQIRLEPGKQAIVEMLKEKKVLLIH